ncbi:hypothetical protein BVRB_5g117620 isoform A [Beta vulgaris subsp. vulgaris]|nr:hypothetical protein BVRB_5g117620 isoform A [Beta vulgaris subsp. vulgaris]
MIRDGTSNSTLVSPGGVFELGFFTPGGNNNKSRFLGIWYNTYNDEPNSKIIVWVANRDKPLLDSGGSLIVKNGSAMVMDIEGVIYWSAEVAPSSNASYCLQDTGNLIGNRMGERVNQVLWQSFDDPTDTFLQGMNGAEALTSWETSNNPALGNYTFLQIEGNKGNKLVIIKKGSPEYWENKVSSFDHAPPILSNISLKNISRLEGYNNTRLVMKFTGQVQFWKWESERGWSLKLAEPNDRCNLNKICGNFGSCNSNNGFLCTCLPGFLPSSPNSWRSGRFFEGCSPTSATCSRSYSDDVFFRMPMMKVIPHNNETNKNCTDACLKDCNCVAYSCGVATCTGTSKERCLMWSNEITGLQEEYRDGITIFIRSTRSIIELTSRNCKTCGIYVIPYPLSTSADCGDPLYADFHCNEKTGQVSFSTSKGTFNVTAIYPEKKRFFIQVRHGNSCDSNSIFGSSKDHSVYSVKNCTSLKEQRFLGVDQSFIEFEMGWKPPREPICSEHSECQAWPLTTCKSPGIGESRCICGSSYNWDGSNVKCTKVSLPLQVLIPCLAAVLASILLCVIFLIYHMQKSRSAKPQGSFEYKEDDPESIDVPFFNWETILDASNNFADANKLGAGGFGSVYRGKLPNGVEIAVKRLSSLSLQGIEEFRTEVKLIAKLQHRNLVRLLGYCTKANEKILVYEFLPNGSLDSCLFDERHSHGLTLLGHAWKMWNEDQGLELIDPKLKESCCSEVVKCINIGLLCVQEDPSDRPSMSTVIHMLNSENTSLPLAKQPPFINRKPLSENASTSSAKDLSVHEVLTVSIVGR